MHIDKSPPADSTDPSAAQDVHRLPGHLIRRAQQTHKRMWVSQVSTEITSPQYGILNAVLAQPGIDQKTAGDIVDIDKSTVGDVVDRLIQKGLIAAERDPKDLRRNVLYLSPTGRRTVADLAPRVLRMNRKLVEALDESDRDLLIRHLEVVIRSAARNGDT